MSFKATIVFSASLVCFIVLTVNFCLAAQESVESGKETIKYLVKGSVFLKPYDKNQNDAFFREKIQKRDDFLKSRGTRVDENRVINFSGTVPQGAGGVLMHESGIDFGNSNQEGYIFFLREKNLFKEIDKAFASKTENYKKVLNLQRFKRRGNKFDPSLALSFSNSVSKDPIVSSVPKLYSTIDDVSYSLNGTYGYNDDFISYYSYLPRASIEKSPENPDIVTVKAKIFDSVPIPGIKTAIPTLNNTEYLKGRFKLDLKKINEFNFNEEVRRSEENSKPREKGNQNDPIKIRKCVDLQKLKKAYEKHIYVELIRDIDCSDTKNWYDGKGFPPVKLISAHNSFHFDGKGHKIIGLYMNNDSESALFQRVKSFGRQSEIKNLTLENVDITGRSIAAVFALEIGAVKFSNIEISGKLNLILAGRDFESKIIGSNSFERNSLAGIAANSSGGSSFENIKLDMDFQVENTGYPSRVGGLVSRLQTSLRGGSRARFNPDSSLMSNIDVKINFYSPNRLGTFGLLLGTLEVFNETADSFIPLKITNSYVSGTSSRKVKQSDSEDFVLYDHFIGAYVERDFFGNGIGPVEIQIESSNSNVEEVLLK